MRSALILSLLAACSFEPNGLGPVKDDAHVALDDSGQPITADAGIDAAGPPHPIDAAVNPLPDASEAPPDASEQPPGPCGGFGQACCEEAPQCGFLLACINGGCF